MVIDVHGHVSAPPELYAYKALLLAGRGAHGRSGLRLPEEKVREAAEHHVKLLDAAGTDLQLISPRPFHLMHSESPSEIVNWWVRAVNDAIAMQCTAYPELFRGVAGLPQAIGSEPADWLDELDRCVSELGFVGVLVNPDPAEGLDHGVPRIGHEWWYPLFERLEELGLPALIHSAGCRSSRENYSEHMITEASRSVISLANSATFEHFPRLKLIISHGGGSIPYQIGRWRASRYLEHTKVTSWQVDDPEAQQRVRPFDESLRHLYFDTLVHDADALAVLVKVVGHERLVFGTEVPGSGSPTDPRTGRAFDDIRPQVESLDDLDGPALRAIFEGNARGLFERLGPEST